MQNYKNDLPYILAYKSRNFGQILDIIFSIRLIRGSVFSTEQYTSKYQIYGSKNSIRLIRGSTYTRVYTVLRPFDFLAQLNSSSPEFAFAKFWEVLKKSSGS